MSLLKAFGRRGTPKSLRLPKRLEIELAKLLGTLGFRAYGSLLWNFAVGETACRDEPIVPISPSIIAQIKDQARHDPRVLAAGEEMLPRLFRARRAPMKERFGIDVAGLFADIEHRAEVVFVTDKRSNLSTHTYLAAISSTLARVGARRTLAIVTDELDHCESDGPGGDIDMRTVLWRTHCKGESAIDPRLLANYLHVLGPRIVIVCESRLGLLTVARYGAALKHMHDIYCTFAGGEKTSPRCLQAASYLRSIMPYGTIVVDSEKSVPLVRDYCGELAPGRVRVLPRGSADQEDTVTKIFGRDFADRRPPVDVSIVSSLLSCRSGFAPNRQAEPELDDVPTSFDVTVSVFFHSEDDLVIPMLASVADMVKVAREAGLTVEVRAILDAPSDGTRELIAIHGAGLDDVFEVCFRDVGLARNAAAEKARGRFLAIMDGDDLWGPQWLLSAHEAATHPGAPREAIWHPEDMYLFWDSDLDQRVDKGGSGTAFNSAHYLQDSSLQPWFDAREILLESLWNGNPFARTTIFLRNPYRAADFERHWGVEDWAWNIETLGRGLPHMVVADTVQIYRYKTENSLDKATNARGMLPVLH